MGGGGGGGARRGVTIYALKSTGYRLWALRLEPPKIQTLSSQPFDRARRRWSDQRLQGPESVL